MSRHLKRIVSCNNLTRPLFEGSPAVSFACSPKSTCVLSNIRFGGGEKTISKPMGRPQFESEIRLRRRFFSAITNACDMNHRQVANQRRGIEAGGKIELRHLVKL